MLPLINMLYMLQPKPEWPVMFDVDSGLPSLFNLCLGSGEQGSKHTSSH